MIPAQFYTGIIAERKSHNHIHVMFSDRTYHEIMLSDVLWHTYPLDDDHQDVDIYLMKLQFRKFNLGKQLFDFKLYPFELDDNGLFLETAEAEEIPQPAIADLLTPNTQRMNLLLERFKRL